MTTPSAPASCTATASGANFHLVWDAPTSNGGQTIWRYVVKVKGASAPVVQLDAPNHTTEYTNRVYDWTTGVPAGATSPTTFQIRAVNDSGFGPWCEAAVSDAPPPPPPPPPGRPFIAYTGTNVFLKSSVLNAPHDSALTTQFRNFMATNAEQNKWDYPLIQGTGGSAGGWGVPYAMSTASDPIWKIGTGTDSSGGNWSELKTTGFHAPANFGDYLSGTTDSPFVVIDMANGFTVWAGKASKGTGNVLNVQSFGAFVHASNGLDNRNPLSDNDKNGRSRGVIPDSMVIRKDQMDWAVQNNSDLGQTLELFFVETDSTQGHTNPMIGHESNKTGWGAEGWRIAIDPNIDLSKRTGSDYAKVIARTLQKYGCYIGDNAGTGSSLKAENDNGSHPVWNGNLSKSELSGVISWDDFVVVQPGWVQ